MAAAPAKTCQSVALRSPWGRLGSILYTCKRLRRRRHRFELWVAFSQQVGPLDHKTYVGRPEGDQDRIDAMSLLGSGLQDSNQLEDASAVKEAELATLRRFGASEERNLATQSNLANTYARLGKIEQALRMRRDVYTGYWKLKGEEQEETLIAASNYAISLFYLQRFEENRALLRKTIPVARRVLGESREITLKMRKTYGRAISKDPAATLDDLREAVTTLEDIEQIARRVLGGAHPTTEGIEDDLRNARAALRARETPSAS